MRRRRRGCFPRMMLLGFLVLLLLGGYMAVNSRVVHLCSADVYLSDLPPSFEGATILFVTDPHVGAFASGEKSTEVIQSLQSLYPDVLLLGGDYAGEDPFSASDMERTLRERDAFFQGLGWFYAPLGKYAVCGCCDRHEGLAEALNLGGIALLRDQMVRLDKGGSSIYLAGLDDWKKGSQDFSTVCGVVGERETVLVLCHDPEAFPSACREGNWFDLMLAGGTHGRQVALPFPRSDPDLSSGWYSQGTNMLLVSNGLGTSLLPFRLNAPAQVHLLTLHCAK